jgi:hypothetical protein
MSMNSKVRDARSNPVVKQKLELIGAQWQPLSNVERWAKIKELRDLECPWSDIGAQVELTESAVRAYKKFETAQVHIEEPDSYYDNPVEQLLQDAKNRKKVKAAVSRLLSRLVPPFQLQTLDLVKKRCDHWTHWGGGPRPVSPDVSPESLVELFDPESDKLDLGAFIQHLATSLFSLVPFGPERDQIIRELRAESAKDAFHF